MAIDLSNRIEEKKRWRDRYKLYGQVPPLSLSNKKKVEIIFFFFLYSAYIVENRMKENEMIRHAEVLRSHDVIHGR
jgi:hypothetical protein